jgi:hypothetical protein
MPLSFHFTISAAMRARVPPLICLHARDAARVRASASARRSVAPALRARRRKERRRQRAPCCARCFRFFRHMPMMLFLCLRDFLFFFTPPLFDIFPSADFLH